MPEEIKEILVGLILGDAHIAKRSSTSNARLMFAQTAVLHKEYFDFVLNLFMPALLSFLNFFLKISKWKFLGRQLYSSV